MSSPNKISFFICLLSLVSNIMSFDSSVSPFSDIILSSNFGNDSDVEKKFREINFSVKCMLVDNFTLYDLTGMAKNIMSEDGKDYKAEINNKTIFYNFCYNLHDKNGCDPSLHTQISIMENNNCTRLAAGISTGNKWRVSDDLIEIEMNEIKGSNQVVKYQIECDENNKDKSPLFILDKSYLSKETESGKYETLLYFKSFYGCPKVDFYVFWKFLNTYDWLFAIILIVAGLFECILGQKLLYPTSFIISCSAVIIFTVIFFFQFLLPPGCASWIIWVILFIGLVIGLFAGYYVSQNKEKILSIVVGGLSGFFLGEFLFNLFGNKFGSHLMLINILFIVICIIVLVVLSLIFSKFIIIFSTSLIGAYGIIRGISFFAGGFPSEFTIIDLSAAGETEQLKKLLSWEIYVYLSSIVVLTGLSIFIQYKINSDQKDELFDEKDENLV